MARIRPNYREILWLQAKGLSQTDIARRSGSSKRTVNRFLRLASEQGIAWPLAEDQTNDVLAKKLSVQKPAEQTSTERAMPDRSSFCKRNFRRERFGSRCAGSGSFQRRRSFLGMLAWVQAFRMLVQKLFADEAEPVVEAGLIDVVLTHILRVGQPARPTVDDDLLSFGELLLAHSV